ncbi:SyrB-like regulator, partial [Neorhizobium sp. T786]|nr:SyrB-like regulator [Neorhizobium xiangyangii]
MAEDNNTGAVTEVIATAAPAEQPAAKKQRAPRGSKISKETTGTSTAPAAKSDVAKRGKRAEKKLTAVAKIAESAPKYTGKRRGRKPTGAQVQQ